MLRVLLAVCMPLSMAATIVWADLSALGTNERRTDSVACTTGAPIVVCFSGDVDPTGVTVAYSTGDAFTQAAATTSFNCGIAPFSCRNMCYWRDCAGPGVIVITLPSQPNVFSARAAVLTGIPALLIPSASPNLDELMPGTGVSTDPPPYNYTGCVYVLYYGKYGDPLCVFPTWASSVLDVAQHGTPPGPSDGAIMYGSLTIGSSIQPGITDTSCGSQGRVLATSWTIACPTSAPTQAPTTAAPTQAPTIAPTQAPTTAAPTAAPTQAPTLPALVIPQNGTFIIPSGGIMVASFETLGGTIVTNGNADTIQVAGPVVLGGTLQITSNAGGTYFPVSGTSVSGVFSLVVSGCAGTSTQQVQQAPQGQQLAVTVECPNNGLSAGAIAGIAVGAILGGVVLALAIFFIIRWQRQRRQTELSAHAKEKELEEMSHQAKASRKSFWMRRK